METHKLNLISNLYAENLLPVLITDETLKVIWSNDKSFVDRLNLADLSTIIDADCLDNTVLIPVKIENQMYNLGVLKIAEKSVVEGYIIRFISLNDTKNIIMNENYINSHISFFSLIRNNVSGIVSMASLLQSSLEQREMYEELEYLNLQINYCYKLLASTVNPSEMTKYYFNIFNTKKLDVGLYMTKITDYVNNIIRDPKVNISCKCEDGVIINIDIDRLLVAVMNIIINSIQYNISESKEIKVTVKKAGEYAVVSITDNGIGISQETINSMLNNLENHKFIVNQSIQSSRACSSGYDVLSKFCKAFDAKIIISSREDEGTTVCLRIPCANESTCPEHLQSDTADYLINRFSNVYLLVSKACQIKYI